MPVDLVEALTEIGRGVLRGNSYAEIASRAEIANAPVDALRSIRGLIDPYARGESSELRDVVLADVRDGEVRGDREAWDRLQQHRQAVGLTRAIENITTVDVAGTIGTINLGAGPVLLGAPVLDRLGVDYTGAAGKRFEAASWDDLPDVSIDPAEKSEVGSAPLTTVAVGDTWHVAITAVNQSQQMLAWTPAPALADFDSMLRAAVSAALEGALLANVTTAATASADITAARVDAAAWPYGAVDTIICSTADQPAVETGFSSIGQWPPPLTIIATPNQAAGTVLVLPQTAVQILTQPAMILAGDDPSLLGKEVAARRDGAAIVRSAIAVRKVVLTP